MNKKSLPLVSVIITSFNSEDYIVEAIDSVLSQTYENIELIVVDDCSTDSTKSICLSYEHLLKFVSLTENSGGPAKPRNTGVKEATGKYVAFLDADDIWVPEKIKVQMSIVTKFGARFVSSSMNRFRHSICENLKTSNLSCVVEKISFEKNLKKNQVNLSSVIIEKSLVSEVKFNELESHVAVEDYDLWLRILKKGINCFKVNAKLVNYRMNPEGISRNKLKHSIKVFRLVRSYNPSFTSVLINYLYYVIISFKRYSKKING